MFSIATLWIPFTITAALGQVARNAMQRQLTGPLGTWGATNIRFLFGFPFSIVFFAVLLTATGDPFPWPTSAFWPWLLLGALCQIIATGLMLLAIRVAPDGFVITAVRPRGKKNFTDRKPTVLGLVAAATFALSAIGFRGAI